MYFWQEVHRVRHVPSHFKLLETKFNFERKNIFANWQEIYSCQYMEIVSPILRKLNPRLLSWAA